MIVEKIVVIGLNLKKHYFNMAEKRTQQQNKAMYKYFELASQKLNDGGYTTKMVLKEKMDVEMNSFLFKELIWMPCLFALFEKTSTADMTTKELDVVYDTVNRFLAEKFKIYQSFPSIELGE